MPANRRAVWIGATLIAAVIAVMVARSGNDAPSLPPGAGATPTAPRSDTAPPAEVNMAALSAPREAPTETSRDPFRFGMKPAAEPAGPPRRLPGVPDDQVGAPPPRVLTGPPPPPPITLKFIGLVQKADGTKIAVLSDGKRPISGTEGEEIEGRYKILKIGTESIEIAYIDGRGRQTIRLTGQ